MEDYYGSNDGDSHRPLRRRGRLFLGLLLGMAIGFALCWYILPKENLSNSKQIAQNQSDNQDKDSNGQKNLSQGSNVETMTLSEIADSLEKSPNEDFERLYLVYAIQLGNYTTAINRIGKERAEREELQKFTKLMHNTSSDVTRRLFDWQSAWGHTDH